MRYKFNERPETEIFINEAGGIVIAQKSYQGEDDSVVIFSYQDIPNLIDALTKCAEEAARQVEVE